MSAPAPHVLVTGATGFVGRHVVAALLAAGCRVTAVSRDPASAGHVSWRNRVAWLMADPFAATVDAVGFDGVDTVLHLAWPDLADYRNRRHFEETAPASYAFLARAMDAGVRRVVVSGTCLEYGLREGAIAADAPCAPVTAYGLGKATLHAWLRERLEGSATQLLWARLFYLHGPGQAARSLFGQLDAAIARGDAAFPMSPGEQLRDYLPIEGAAARVAELTLGAEHGAVNVCSGQPVSIRRLVEGVLAQRGVHMELELGRYGYPAWEPLAFWGVP